MSNSGATKQPAQTEVHENETGGSGVSVSRVNQMQQQHAAELAASTRTVVHALDALKAELTSLRQPIATLPTAVTPLTTPGSLPGVAGDAKEDNVQHVLETVERGLGEADVCSHHFPFTPPPSTSFLYFL